MAISIHVLSSDFASVFADRNPYMSNHFDDISVAIRERRFYRISLTSTHKGSGGSEKRQAGSCGPGHKLEGSSVREHRNTCAKRAHERVASCASTKTPCAEHSTRARARKSQQAQLAAGRGPGVGARSPSPPGTASSASGAAGARHQRAHGGSLHAPAQTCGSLRAPAQKHPARSAARA